MPLSIATLILTLWAGAFVGCATAEPAPPEPPSRPTPPPPTFVPNAFSGGMHGDPERWVQLPFRITYPSGGASLDDAARATLRELRDDLDRLPGVSILVVGHAFNASDAETNHQLGFARAQDVVDYMVVELDMSRELFQVESYGDTSPLTRETPPTDEPPNGRVVFFIDGEHRSLRP